MPAEEYFEHTRKDIAPLLPASALNALEIGCGTGSTLAWLKIVYPNLRTVGIEGNGTLRDQLKNNVDDALIADLDLGIPKLGSFDLILALDVLEHLKDPERALGDLRKMLTPDGALIVSLPNVAHWPIGMKLAMLGRFDYEDAGVMDRTHLHFFTDSSARQMIDRAGLAVHASLPIINGRKDKLANMATLGALKYRLASQLIFKTSASGY